MRQFRNLPCVCRCSSPNAALTCTWRPSRRHLSCASQLVDQVGIGKPTDYIPVAGPVTVSVNGTNTYVFMGLTLLVRTTTQSKTMLSEMEHTSLESNFVRSPILCQASTVACMHGFSRRELLILL